MSKEERREAERNRKKNKKRARRIHIRRMLYGLLICAAILGALIIFFRLEKVEVQGNLRYSESEIVESSQVTLGKNMFLLNKVEITNSICTKLPFVEKATLRRKLPSTILIEVEECQPAAKIYQDSVWYLISSNGKIVETKTASEDEIPTVTGLRLLMPTLSETIAVSVEDTPKKEALLTILEAGKETNMTAYFEGIDLSKATEITLQYTERFLVRIPWNGDYEYKIKYLKKVVDRLEVNETGTIDLLQDDKAHFIPTREEPVKPEDPIEGEEEPLEEGEETPEATTEPTETP